MLSVGETDDVVGISFCSTGIEIFEEISVEVPVKSWFAMLFFWYKEFSTYPSATVLLFQPPCLLSWSMVTPESANSDADVLRKQWPVYKSASESFKYFAILVGSCPIVFLPIGWDVHFPFLYPTKNLVWPCIDGGLKAIYFLTNRTTSVEFSFDRFMTNDRSLSVLVSRKLTKKKSAMIWDVGFVKLAKLLSTTGSWHAHD